MVDGGWVGYFGSFAVGTGWDEKMGSVSACRLTILQKNDEKNSG